MSEHHEGYRASVNKLLKMKSAEFSGIDAQELTRMPKGFAPDDPADELLRAKNWGVHAMLPAGTALKPALAKEIVRRMKAAAPVVEMLNGAILAGTSNAERPRGEGGFRPLF
jgi:uncharacterized protein (DUF2461 family)